MNYERQILPFMCSVIVTHKNGLPAIELRRVTTNIEVIKPIVFCAMHNRDIIVRPSFTNQVKSLASLIDKGLVYYDKESNEYKFTI